MEDDEHQEMEDDEHQEFIPKDASFKSYDFRSRARYPPPISPENKYFEFLGQVCCCVVVVLLLFN